jgi:hypothetical protein
MVLGMTDRKAGHVGDQIFPGGFGHKAFIVFWC